MEEILTQIDAEATTEPKELGLQFVESHVTASFTTEPKSEHSASSHLSSLLKESMKN